MVWLAVLEACVGVDRLRDGARRGGERRVGALDELVLGFVLYPADLARHAVDRLEQFYQRTRDRSGALGHIDERQRRNSAHGALIHVVHRPLATSRACHR